MMVKDACSYLLATSVLWMVLGCTAIPLGQHDENLDLIPINISVPPVVLVPGIGGSIMSDASSGVRVWIRLYEADTYFERFMWGRYNASSMKVEPFPGQPLVAPVLTGYGLDGIRNLDPSVRWPIYDYVAYFDAMIQELESQGWIHGVSLFGVPWDWRQSMCWTPTLDRLEEALRAARERNNGRKVALISHSMGALVVKCFMARRPEVFEEAVETWVAIAAPHQGASAKIFMEFLQGYNLGNIVIEAEAAKVRRPLCVGTGGADVNQVLSLEAPAVYELLPQENFQWEEQPYIALQWKNGTRQVFGETSDTLGYDIPIRNSLVDHKMTLPWSGETLPEPFNEDCWELSQSTRKEIFEVQHPQSLRFYNIYGTNQATPNGLEFTGAGENTWSQQQTDVLACRCGRLERSFKLEVLDNSD